MLKNLFCLKEIIDNLGHRVEVFLDSKETFKTFEIIRKVPFNSPFSTSSTIRFLSHLMHLLERPVLSQKRTGYHPFFFFYLQVLGSVSRESNNFCRF